MVPVDNQHDEMASLSSLMKHKMEGRPKLLSSSAGKEECCIFRVPPDQVKIDEEAYCPHVVSIGPYHHGEEPLQMLEEQKWRFLSLLLARCEPHGIHLQELIDAISPEEERIRGSYSECIDKFSRSELVMMMVLDGCFIIEFLAVMENLVLVYGEPFLNVGWIKFAVLQDLLRLENQIPYFVLEKLFEETRASGAMSLNNSTTTLAVSALNVFNCIMQRPNEIIRDYIGSMIKRRDPPKHLLDMCRACIVSPFIVNDSYKRTYRDPNHPEVIQSIQMLRKAGIKLQLRKSTKSFIEIKFNEGILEIPFLKLHIYNQHLLQNFIAFEQCQTYCPSIIISYVSFMGYLIGSGADAEYLESKEIIDNLIGTHEEVAHFFTQLRKIIFFQRGQLHLVTVFDDINEYCRSKWHVGWGGIKYKYFAAPWAWIAALGAVLGLLLTATQTVFSILSYANPPK